MSTISITLDDRLKASPGIGTFLKLLTPLLEKHFKVQLLSREMKAPIYSLQEQLQYPYKIPSCDLFISPHFNVPLLPIRAKKRITVIHDAFHLDHLQTFNWKEKIYARSLYKAAFAISDAVVTVSNFSKERLSFYHPSKAISVLYPSLFIPALREPIEKVRKKYHLPEKFMLSVLSPKPHKNGERLKRVAQQVDLPLVVIGKGLFEVEDEELPAFYQLAHFFVFPSLHEGFGFPPLEAMHYGCPAVVSNRGAIPEICGNAVEYADCTSDASLLLSLQRMVKEERLREELKVKGCERARFFSMEAMEKKWVNLIESIC